MTPEELRWHMQYICSLSETEMELYFLRRDLLEGKIFRRDDERYDPCGNSCYEDAVCFTLYCAFRRGIITSKEKNRLFLKYMKEGA